MIPEIAGILDSGGSDAIISSIGRGDVGDISDPITGGGDGVLGIGSKIDVSRGGSILS